MRFGPPDPEPPVTEPVVIDVMIAYCRDCRDVIGPTLSENVGEEIWHRHRHHEVETIDKWEETTQ